MNEVIRQKQALIDKLTKTKESLIRENVELFKQGRIQQYGKNSLRLHHITCEITIQRKKIRNIKEGYS